METYFQSFGTLETWIKIVIVIAAAPIWIPVGKVFWAEIQHALSDDGGFLGRSKPTEVARREPHLDPWINVPRGQRHQGGGPRRAAPRPPGRRS